MSDFVHFIAKKTTWGHNRDQETGGSLIDLSVTEDVKMHGEV